MRGAGSVWQPSYWFRPFIQEPIDHDNVDSKERFAVRYITLFLVALALPGLAIATYQYVTLRLATALASGIIWDCAVILLLIRRLRTGSILQVALYLGISTCHVVSLLKLSTRGWSNPMAWDIVGILVALMSMIIVLNMPLRDPSLPQADISRTFELPEKDKRSPEDSLTLWQWMSVSWMTPLIKLGSERQLNDEDIWLLGYEFQHTHLHEAFRTVRGTVVWRLVKANWIDLFILTFLCVFEMVGKVASPVLLQRLLQSMGHLDVDKRPALTWATAMVFVRVLTAQSGIFSLWFGRRCYERSRGEMITMLHEKVLNRKVIGMDFDTEAEDRQPSAGEADESSPNEGYSENGASEETDGLLSGKPQSEKSSANKLWSRLMSWLSLVGIKKKPQKKQPASMGKILNLMRSDVYEVAQRFWDYEDIINKPLGLILSIALVWRLIGWSCLVGVAVVLVAQILNGLIARILISFEKTRRQTTDLKLQRITQFIEGIRHLRWYGWHQNMLQDVMSARQKELNIRVVTYALQNVIMLVNILASGLLPVASFWAYTALAHQELRVDVVFPALQLFSLLQSSLRDLPGLITSLINAAIAVGRIEGFMSEPDVAVNNATDHGDHLELRNASFSWPGISEEVLHNITASFEPGLNLIIGPVASGKTALLLALLGEIDLRSGQLIKPDTAIAYCAQSPWLQSMSIRENILFGSPHDLDRYHKVLEVCALLPDLESFEHGDLSPIGENGIGLSGGQKARVALARAVYSKAKYILLDDPISALDQQTAEWIVNKCFQSPLLEGRTTVLVTHRTDLCQHVAKQTLTMSDGTASVNAPAPTTKDGLDLRKVDSLPGQPTGQAKSTSAVPEKFEDVEHRAHGGVKFSVYWEYIKAGRLRIWALVILAMIFWRFFDYLQTWFIKEWAEAYKSVELFQFMTGSDFDQSYSYVQHVPVTQQSWSSKILKPVSDFLDGLPDPNRDVKPWLVTLVIVVLIQNASVVFSSTLMLVVTYVTGKNMFASIMVSISNATFRFYDVTPVGRLMNRITGDVGIVDGPISQLFREFSWNAINWTLSLGIVATVAPLFLVMSVVLTLSFVYIFLRFLPTSQSLRRLEMVSLSPLMSNFGALLHGLTTVRAFNAQTQFQARVINVTDAFQKMDHFYWSLQGWLMYRFDMLSALSAYLLAVLAIFSGLTPGLTAFVLAAASRFVNATHSLCSMYGKLQLDFVSVERVVELLHLEQEDPGTLTPPASWPSVRGDVVFENVTIRYAPHLPPALKNISCTIPGGKSTAIVGRTGSGKSTLALSLLATITPESGRILIDNIDISKVNKQILRERITFLAQDPILFPGTLRTNLDPLNNHTDAECHQVLSLINGPKYNWTLTTPVDTAGSNLSQGQRQLVGLARALLRRSTLIIMDEATASIDFETSTHIQRLLRTELGYGQSTIIGIAHRVTALEGADLAIKLSEGELG